MSAVGQVYHRVLDTGSGVYVSSGQDIYTDIVAQYGGATQLTKLGIQAPAGTRLVINKNKNIIVGRTGIYELDDEIPVTNLYFLRPRKYIKNQGKSDEMMAKGMADMQEAENLRAQDLANLNADYPEGPPTDVTDEKYSDYWSTYQQKQSNYDERYKVGLTEYETGQAGIYQLPNPDNTNAPENYEDLYNVIVDFIYE